MRTEVMILVSVDDHVVEPPGLFDNHLAPQWKDRAPRLVKKKDGSDIWVYEGQQLMNIGLNAVEPDVRAGIEFEGDVADIDIVGAKCFVLFRDPDGTLLELIEF